MEIGERVKQIRKSQKLSQTSFGEKLGVGRDVINNIENNRVDPKEIFIQHLCTVFFINEEWLRAGDGEKSSQDDQSIIRTLKAECGANDRDAKIIEAYLRLPDEYREAIKRFALNLADNLTADDGKVDK